MAGSCEHRRTRRLEAGHLHCWAGQRVATGKGGRDGREGDERKREERRGGEGMGEKGRKGGEEKEGGKVEEQPAHRARLHGRQLARLGWI